VTPAARVDPPTRDRPDALAAYEVIVAGSESRSMHPAYPGAVTLPTSRTTPDMLTTLADALRGRTVDGVHIYDALIERDEITAALEGAGIRVLEGDAALLDVAGHRLAVAGVKAEAIDGRRVDLAVHGHAHAGTEKGVTAGGTRVRNVAQPVLRRAYAVYCVGDGVD